MGRFIQADPPRKSGPGVGGWNRYAYVGKSPVGRVDPSGLTRIGVDPEASTGHVFAQVTIPIPVPLPPVARPDVSEAGRGRLLRILLLLAAVQATDMVPPDDIRIRTYYRLESPTQDALTALRQQLSGQIWGGVPQGGFFPAVQAYYGPLPAGTRGIEFITFIDPDPGSPPLMAYWRGPRRGVAVVGDVAVLSPVFVTSNTQTFDFELPGYTG